MDLTEEACEKDVDENTWVTCCDVKLIMRMYQKGYTYLSDKLAGWSYHNCCPIYAEIHRRFSATCT